jgi:hypothetical protein
MTRHYRRLAVGLVVGIAISAAAIGSSAFINRASNAASEAIDNVRIVDDRKLPRQWAINAAYGRGALSNLRAALIEITNDNVQEASKGVAVARSLLTRIALESPSDSAASDHDVQAATDFVLVHSEVRVLGETDPANSVQVTLDNIRREFEVTDHNAIVRALSSLNVPLAYTRIDLPLSDTIALVDDVLRALDSQNNEQARSKLMDIGSRLRIETVRIGTQDAPTKAPETVEAG